MHISVAQLRVRIMVPLFCYTYVKVYKRSTQVAMHAILQNIVTRIKAVRLECVAQYTNYVSILDTCMITEHDFITPRWGHHVRQLGNSDKEEVTKRLFRKAIVRPYREYWGHGTGLKEGDKVKVMDRDGRIVKYTVRKLEYQQDPWDMFFFRIYFDEIEIDDT